MIVRTIAGLGTGLLWYLVLSAVEGARGAAVEQGTVPFLALFGALLVSLSVVLIIGRLGARFGIGVSAALLVCLLIGVIEGNLVQAANLTDLFVIPGIFGRGVGSVATWVALSCSAALALTSRKRGAVVRA